GTAPDDLEQCLFVAVAAGATVGLAGDAVGLAGDAVRGYVRKVFAEVLRFRDSDLDDRVTFENYGVDSLVSLDILGRFERDLGTAPDDLEQCLFVAVAAGATVGLAGDAVGLAGDAVRGYVRKVFAEVLRFRDSDLDDRVTFENYGVDSLVSLDILGRFERDLG